MFFQRITLLYQLLILVFIVPISFCIPSANAQDGNEVVEEMIKEGLVAFRKTGAIIGESACAHCHAPDGIDLAYFDFDTETLVRRIGPHLFAKKLSPNHLTEDDVESIVNMVEALRIKYDITPRDPIKSPPFQPGGEALPGNTIEEQDLAFGKQLQEMGFHFANVPILSKEEAIYQKEEWLSVEPKVLPIGMPLNPWSRDPHFGGENASIADWLPDFPRLPKAGKEKEWIAVQDKYLAEPSDENFLYLYEKVDELTQEMKVDASRPAMRFMNLKYKSVLLAQHMFRKEVLQDNCLECRSTTAFFPLRGKGAGPDPNHRFKRDTQSPNPIWDVGDEARKFRTGDGESPNGGAAKIVFPESVMSRIDNGSDRPIREELLRIKVPWFWAGWLFDQSLQYSSSSNSTKTAEYFTTFIRSDFEDNGYGIHAAFMVGRKMIAENFDPDSKSDPNEHMNIKYSRFHDFGWDWKRGALDSRKDIYVLMVENNYRMWMYLMQEEIDEKGKPTDGELKRWKHALDRYKYFFEQAKTEHYNFNIKLYKETSAKL